MPVHHLLERILDEYILAANLKSGQPLFQSLNSVGTAVTGRALNRTTLGLLFGSGPRQRVFLPALDVTPGGATGITIYLENDGRLEHAQQMAGHESPRTLDISNLWPEVA
jgi:integrase/recombinase XerD